MNEDFFEGNENSAKFPIKPRIDVIEDYWNEIPLRAGEIFNYVNLPLPLGQIANSRKTRGDREIAGCCASRHYRGRAI